MTQRILGLVLLGLALSGAGDAWALTADRSCEILLKAGDVRGNVLNKRAIAELVASASPLDATQILELIQAPKKSEHGDYAIPLFAYAKEQKQNPVEFAKQLAIKINEVRPEWLKEASSVSGFLNLKLSPINVQRQLAEAFNKDGAAMGHSTWAHGKTVVIDFVSPNLAKPLHVGHFRASVIGQAIRGLAETQGFRVIGLNHLGDWGIQFGYLVWAYQNWGKEYDFENAPFKSLYDLYVRVKREALGNPELEAGGREAFRRMENGDREELAIWEKFREITLKENQQVLDLLGIRHDLVLGESFYNAHLPGLEARLREQKLLIEDQGALGVCTSEGKFCMLRTKAGTSVYAARDLASALYRKAEVGADEVLYVVGNEQKEHFKAVFDVLKQMNLTGVEDFHHIGFGLYLSGGKKISSRDGGTLTINELVQAVSERAKAALPSSVQREDVALQIGLGSLIYNDLAADRNGDVDFNWDRLLNVEGGGPYIQATVERARKAAAAGNSTGFSATLDGRDEVELMRTLLDFQEVLTQSYITYQPSHLTSYLMKLARAYNALTQRYTAEAAVAEDVVASRLYLTKITGQVLREGLRILHIDSPEGI